MSLMYCKRCDITYGPTVPCPQCGKMGERISISPSGDAPVLKLTDKKDAWIEELIVWAERYVIYRGSYANGATAETVKKIVESGILTHKTLDNLRRDITIALNDDNIPYQDQRDEWSATLSAINTQLMKEVKT